MMRSFTLFLLLTTCAAFARTGTPVAAKGKYFETCGCKVSCPCGTNKFLPTEGHCDAVMLFQMEKANVGRTRLDGLRFAVVIKSPKDRKVNEAFSKGEMDHF